MYVVPVKSKGNILQNFVAFSEYMNFIKQQDARLEGLKFRKSFLFFISELVRGATTGKLLDDRLDNNQG